MRLVELFDRPLSYTWKEKAEDLWEGSFRSPSGQLVSFIAEKQGKAWEVVFHVNQSQNVTGEGDEIPIFSTVLKMLFEFAQTMEPWKVVFESSEHEPSRVKLYNAMVSKYARANGYSTKIKQKGSGSFVFVLANIS